jgi:hypothetical protein
MSEYANERRNFVRTNTHLPIQFGIDSPSFSGVIDSIGFGGARIRSSHTFGKGTNLRLRLSVSDNLQPFEGAALVAWVQDKEMMGVQFIELPPTEVIKLEKILIPSATGLGEKDLWD